jgi:2-amino-4-hydroxy-6-hydroxymethyldihydropteridine diphosphokinase
MKIAFLGLGTNLGTREVNLKKAIDMIEYYIGSIEESSSMYETEPWGFQSDQKFLNCAVKVKTDLDPSDLMEKILMIESLLGRKRAGDKYSSRIIDIDILLYGDLITETSDLKIPHPRMHERRFVLVPLFEIAPDEIHPVLEQSIGRLLEVCKDQSNVVRF